MWYIGDPCYLVDDDERWDNFVKLTYAKESLARAKEYCGGDHVDSIINFEGQEIIIWSDGGDGTWTFPDISDISGKNSFCVDTGIFCLIDLKKFNVDDDPKECGLVFEHQPQLRVEDGVVYIRPRDSTGIRSLKECADDSVHGCGNCSSLVKDSWYDDEAGEDRCERCW